MKRKVIQLAGRTLVVSLPSKWAKKYNILKGDEVLVEELGHRLQISSEKSIINEKTKLSIVGMDPMVKRVLGAVYKAGYDEVEVEYADKELESAQEVIREEFIGFEVIYKGRSTLNVKKISSIDPQEFENIMRRIFMILIQMAEESAEAMEKKDKEWLKTIMFMDKDINKYADFCRRVLNKFGHTKFRVSPPLYYIVEQLERIGDSYRDICKYLIDNELSVSSEVKELFSQVNRFVKEFYSLFYKFDLNELARFGKQRYELVDKFNKTFQSCSKQELPLLLLLYTVLDNTFDMNGALMATKV